MTAGSFGICALRLAESLEREADVAEHELASRDRKGVAAVQERRRRIGDRSHLHPVVRGGTAGERNAGNQQRGFEPPVHLNLPLSAGMTARTTRMAAGSIKTPIIVGSMHATSGIEISTGSRCAFSSARRRRFSRISLE